MADGQHELSDEAANVIEFTSFTTRWGGGLRTLFASILVSQQRTVHAVVFALLFLIVYLRSRIRSLSEKRWR